MRAPADLRTLLCVYDDRSVNTCIPQIGPAVVPSYEIETLLLAASIHPLLTVFKAAGCMLEMAMRTNQKAAPCVEVSHELLHELVRIPSL